MGSWALGGARAGLLESLPLARDRRPLAYAGSLAICLLALAVRVSANGVMSLGFPYVGFFPAVILATFLFGVGPGIMAGVLCGVFAWYFFIPPFWAVKMSGPVALTLAFYSAVVAVNIVVLWWMQVANDRLRIERERNRQLAERSELLFRELQHRVSNNLQVVGGLLTLQKRDVADEQAKAALDEAAQRLGLIGRIHRQLYDPSGEQLRLTAFLQELTSDLIKTSGKEGIVCTINAHDDLALEPDAAVPTALIVAEAIANAIEHGFADRENGAIVIHIARRGDFVEISVTDDGAGLPAGFDLAKTDSLGLRLAQMLAMQLGGQFSLASGKGTIALLRLKL